MQGAMDQTDVVPNQGLTHDLFLCPPQLQLTATYLKYFEVMGARQWGIHPKCKSWANNDNAGDSKWLGMIGYWMMVYLPAFLEGCTHPQKVMQLKHWKLLCVLATRREPVVPTSSRWTSGMRKEVKSSLFPPSGKINWHLPLSPLTMPYKQSSRMTSLSCGSAPKRRIK